jgi:hypothetical protein
MFNLFSKKEKEPQNLDEVLKEIKSLRKEVQLVFKEFEVLKKESKFFVQKIGIIRYNPFSNVGSDQSFSLALLDADNNGMVITSLFSQEGNRVYGKPVENGSSQYSLSDEEKKAIEKAIQKL